MKTLRMVALAVAAAALLGACATTNPGGAWSVLDGSDWNHADPYAAPVQIATIDGKDYLRLSRRALPPGKHKITFLTTQVLRINTLRHEQEAELDLAPCTAYYYYAKHSSKFDPRWELRLLREVKLESCTPESTP